MKKILLLGFVPLTCVFFLIFLSFNSGIFAGTTGKIQGTIIESESKEALPGVNVVVEGTTLGAAADANGFFFIINVPPGTYQLKTSMVGYAAETKEDVRVYVDRTTITDFELKSQAVAGEEVTVTAQRVPVPLDVSSTEAYVSGEDVVESPIGRFDELMGYQAGVEFSNQSRLQQAKGFSVRGGDVPETDVQIDGVSLMNKQTQGVNVPISRNLIQDVQILTGGFNAEYGNIRSGLINVVTKDGSYNRYSGVLETRFSPKDYKHWGPSPYDQDTETGNEYAFLYFSEETGIPGSTDKKFNFRECTDYPDGPYVLSEDWKYYRTWIGFEAYAKKLPYSPQYYYDEARWWHRPYSYLTTGDIMADVSAGGPVPSLSNTKFYLSGYWNRAEFPLMTSRPRSHEYSTSLKITQRIKSNMVLTLGGFSTFVYGVYSSENASTDFISNFNRLPSNNILADDRMMFARSRYFRQFDGIFDNPLCNMMDERTNTMSLKFTHTVTPSTYYELSAAAFLYDADVHRMRWTDPTIIHWITDSETGESNGYTEFPRGWSTRGVYAPGKTSQQRFCMRYHGKGLKDNFMSDYLVRGNFVSQINRYNQLKAGFSLSKAHIRNIDEYHSSTQEHETIDKAADRYYKYIADPWQFEWFIQDKLEWEGMIMNFGLRAQTYFPGQNGFDLGPDTYFSSNDAGPFWDYKAQWGSEEGEGNWMFQTMQTRKLKTKILLQPRLGISHPITESSKIFFNYGHFYNQPRSLYLYCVTSRGGTFIPSPDLTWPKVIAYEIGYSQSIYNQVLLQISGYYKDYGDETALYYWQGGDNNARSYDNLGYKDIRGLEFRLERSFGRFFNGWANYNYMIKSTGITGIKNVYPEAVAARLSARDIYYDQGQYRPEATPTFRANFGLRTPVGWGPGRQILGVKPLAEFRMNLLVRWQDGGRKVWNSSDPPRDWMYVDYANVKMWDLYVSKRIARGAQLYCQVLNVFNVKRLAPEKTMGTFEGNSYEGSLHLWFEQGDEKGDDKIGDYKNSYIYIPPFRWRNFLPDKRDWFFGIRYQF